MVNTNSYVHAFLICGVPQMRISHAESGNLAHEKVQEEDDHRLENFFFYVSLFAQPKNGPEINPLGKPELHLYLPLASGLTNTNSSCQGN